MHWMWPHFVQARFGIDWNNISKQQIWPKTQVTDMQCNTGHTHILCIGNRDLMHKRQTHMSGCGHSVVVWRVEAGPGWPLEESPQLSPQALVRLLLAQTSLCFQHQYLQAVTHLQDKDYYYCQEINLQMHEACERGKKKKKPVLM